MLISGAAGQSRRIRIHTGRKGDVHVARSSASPAGSILVTRRSRLAYPSRRTAAARAGRVRSRIPCLCTVTSRRSTAMSPHPADRQHQPAMAGFASCGCPIPIPMTPPLGRAALVAPGHARPRVGARARQRVRRLPPALRLRRAVARPTSRPCVDAVRASGQAVRLHRARPAQPAPPDRAAHDAQLDVLVPAADARDHADRRGRRRDPASAGVARAVVLPHPHVVDFETMHGRTAAGGRARPAPAPASGSGCTLKSLRAEHGPDGRPADAASTPSAALPGAVLQVDGHRDVLDADGARHDAELAASCGHEAAAAALELARPRLLHRRRAVGLPRPRSTSRCCPTGSARTRAGSRPAATSAPPCSRPTCGYYADQGPVLQLPPRRGRPRRRLARARAVRARLRRRARGWAPIRSSERRRQRDARRRAPTPRSTAIGRCGERHAPDLPDRLQPLPDREPFAGGLEAHTHALADRAAPPRARRHPLRRARARTRARRR